jgi:hypothetical protein
VSHLLISGMTYLTVWLGISNVVMCDAAVVAFWWRRDTNLEGRKLRKYISYLLPLLVVLSIECQRA